MSAGISITGVTGNNKYVELANGSYSLTTTVVNGKKVWHKVTDKDKCLFFSNLKMWMVGSKAEILAGKNGGWAQLKESDLSKPYAGRQQGWQVWDGSRWVDQPAVTATSLTKKQIESIEHIGGFTIHGVSGAKTETISGYYKKTGKVVNGKPVYKNTFGTLSLYLNSAHKWMVAATKDVAADKGAGHAYLDKAHLPAPSYWNHTKPRWSVDFSSTAKWKVWNNSTKTWKVESSLKCEALKKSTFDSFQNTPGYSIKGCTGAQASIVNGYYKETSERINGRPVYQKIEDASISFFFNSNSNYMITDTDAVAADKSAGFAYEDGATIGGPGKDGVWKVSDGGWKVQSSIKCTSLTKAGLQKHLGLGASKSNPLYDSGDDSDDSESTFADRHPDFYRLQQILNKFDAQKAEDANYAAEAKKAGTEVPIVFTKEQRQQVERHKGLLSDVRCRAECVVAGLWVSPDVTRAMKLAKEYGLDEDILAARVGFALALYPLQCAACTYWSHWTVASQASKKLNPTHGKQEPVLNAIVKLQQSKALAALNDSVSKLADRVFATIPGKVGAEIQGINTQPRQDMGLRSAPRYKQWMMKTWTRGMFSELKAADAILRSGVFGNPRTFSADGREDFMMILGAFDIKTNTFQNIRPINYLIACGINRHSTFAGKVKAIAAAVVGAKFTVGPLKTDKRIDAKCTIGGDYHSFKDADVPNCMFVLDVLRAIVTCTSHAKMLKVRAIAVEVFGGQEPAVLKDRRMKVQHDMLLVFQVDGMYCELQLHFEQTMCIKSLMHAVFEIQRLNTGRDVASSGLDTVLKENSGKALMHI